MNRNSRKIRAQETMSIIETGKYISNNKIEVDIENKIQQSKLETKVYSSQVLAEMKQVNSDTNFVTKIEIENEDVVSCIHRLTKINDKVMCLNFASGYNAGGGFQNGALAQEESLAISSNLYETQINTTGFYDLHRKMKSYFYSDTIIYSPNVQFFRDGKGKLLDQPSSCNIITSAAVNKGVVLERQPHLAQTVEKEMEKRIHNVLAVAKANHNDTLILGAWGCGVFKNDPMEIAKLFKKQLDNNFKNEFKHVVFAIYARNDRFINAFKLVFDL